MRNKTKIFKFATFAFIFCGLWRFVYAVSIEDYTKDTTVNVHYTNTIAATITSTDVVLIDLSNTTQWPHKIPQGANGFISITGMHVDVDKVATSTFTAKFGVITAVDSSTGSVTWFLVVASSLNLSNTSNSYFNYNDNQYLDLKVIPPVPNSGLDGTTPYLISNDSTSGSTTYQTDVWLSSLVSTGAISGLGDIVMSYKKDALNPQILNVDIKYHVEPF